MRNYEPENNPRAQNDVSSQPNVSTPIAKLTEERPSESNAIQNPSIELPKGGGALKGIDEKFEVNAANGTSGFNIPLPITPGRNGFSPSLSLSYNSGGGNSPYGLGWSVGYPMIQRKTDKRIPRYRDGDDADIFMFSGTEDLVPYLDENDGNWNVRETDTAEFRIRQYRPRVEGGLARIESIRHPTQGHYWKVTTRENITTFFGLTQQARLSDPEDNRKIFAWLPEFSTDDKGNWIRYEYRAENLENVANDLHERNRFDGLAAFTNRYLKTVKYGNRVAYYADEPYLPTLPEEGVAYFFELVMDYGEHDSLQPIPRDHHIEGNTWDARPDPFSSYRSGFEIRTYRRCQRILMFHHFPDELQQDGTPFGADYLVRSLDLEYIPSSINDSGQTEFSYLQSITQRGYIRLADGSYSSQSLPPMEFDYQHLQWNTQVRVVDRENIANAPVGLSNGYQWVDLYGEGISGILTEQAGAWYYKNNLGTPEEGPAQVQFSRAQEVIPKPSFTGLAAGVLSLQDLEANGQKQVVVNSPDLKGYFELTPENDFHPFQSFDDPLNLNLQDPNTRLIDLNGDGKPDLVVTEESVFTWYASAGKKGYRPAEHSHKTFDEEQGPAIIFFDSEQTLFLADMSGDGLTDIVRICNGDICYWANKGYGRFSAKVTMSNAPVFDFPESFNPRYIQLADVSGTGATDIIDLGKNQFKAYINLSGNAWSAPHEIEPFFPVNANTQLSVVDLLGTGTACIVWSSGLPADAHAPMRYIDLMDSTKPHVLTRYVNNMGKETTLEYKSSTHFYLKDKRAGRPWITKLPFPVQVVSKTVVEDKITDVRFTSDYSYHHGYYDHPEREFRGFGMVEQLDTEFYEERQRNNTGNRLEKSEAFYQAPTLTKTWFHTGAFLERERMLTHFRSETWDNEYNRMFPDSPLTITEPALPDARIVANQTIADRFDINDLSADEYREALRACKGMALRQEVFSLDASRDNPTTEKLQTQQKPYSVATHTCQIQLLQPREANSHAVFLVTESEALSIHYERNETDPRIAHTLNIELDELGNVLKAASVVYPRRIHTETNPFTALRNQARESTYERENEREAYLNSLDFAEAEQQKTLITFTENALTNDVISNTAYRLRQPAEAKTYEITGLPPLGELYQVRDFENTLTDPEAELQYHEAPDPTAPSESRYRLIEHVQTTYYNDGLTAELPLGQLSVSGISYQSYQLGYTPELLTEIFGDKLPADPADLNTLLSDSDDNTDGDNRYSQCRFVHRGDNRWWVRSGTVQFLNSGEAMSDVRNRFFSPLSYRDPFGSETHVGYYRDYYLFTNRMNDAIGNETRVDAFNFRTLSPTRMRDINDNLSEVILNELGLVKAMAVMGKGEEADNLLGLSEATANSEREAVRDYFTLSETAALQTAARSLLQNATARFVYDFHRYQSSVELLEEQLVSNPDLSECARVKILPTVVSSVVREQHFRVNPESPLQLSFEYSDGMSNVAMAKAQAEPGEALNLVINPDCTYTVETIDTRPTGQLRWIGNGRTILNNKGNPVKQYEPYFSVNPFYEDNKELVEHGVTPIIYYDAPGRVIRTELPDGTFTKVEFNAWQQTSYDPNDTVMDGQWYRDRSSPNPDTAAPDDPESLAAWKAAQHYNTPTTVHVDTLGRPILSVTHNRVNGVDEWYATRIDLDIEGNARAVVDARENMVMSWKYDMLGHRVFQQSMDAGRRWMLNNVADNPIRSWDERNHRFDHTYDILQRPLATHVRGGDGATPLNHTISRTIYGEGLSDASERNLRGQVYQHYDASGLVQTERLDFKGNLLRARRQLAAAYDAEAIDWPEEPTSSHLEAEVFTKITEYDALNRMVRQQNWHSEQTGAGSYQPQYNERGVLQSEELTLGDDTTNAITETEYNEKGQPTRIRYGNGTVARYHYDPKTFRLIQLRTTRNSRPDERMPTAPSGLRDAGVLQNLYYTTMRWATSPNP